MKNFRFGQKELTKKLLVFHSEIKTVRRSRELKKQ